MAYFHTNVLDPQIKALPTVSTASGSVATFDTDLTENLIECVCDIQYSQASGTPTPDNPIPITVYNALNLSHSGADTSNPTIINIPFGQTVAKGTLDVLSGVFSYSWIGKKLNDLTWTYNSGSGGYFSASTPLNERKAYGITNVVCGCYQTSDSASVSGMVEDSIKGANNSNSLYIKDSSYTNVTDLMNDVGNYIFGYELVTPVKILLDSNQVQALLNENNIWCDTNGDTSVKYLLSVGKKIS